MLVSQKILASALCLIASVTSFPVLTTTSTTTSSPKLSALLMSSKHDDTKNNKNWVSMGQQVIASAFVAATVWSSPAPTMLTNLMPQQLDAAATMSSVANAKEMASGTGSRVNKDAESLLRYGLPIDNKQVRKLQVTLETTKYDISSKRKAAALDGVKKSGTLMKADKEKYKASCRDPKYCDELVESMSEQLAPLSAAIKSSMDSSNGSDQERSALDKAYLAQQNIVKLLNSLEEQMIPAGYKVEVPAEYSALPRLQGRATVEMLLKKEVDGDTFDVNGLTFTQAKLTMVIDGYTSPVTSGNFVELVQKGFYDKMLIQRSDGFVVQTGDPDGPADGYVAPGTKAVGNGLRGERLIPLEISAVGDKAPFYESTIEDELRGGEATRLPFSSYGAMGWARDEYDANSGSSQFFWLLFDSDLTPAGKNVLDGRYPCFGYVVEGSDFLSDIKEGDVILSAKVTEGAENLILGK